MRLVTPFLLIVALALGFGAPAISQDLGSAIRDTKGAVEDVKEIVDDDDDEKAKEEDDSEKEERKD